MSLYAKLAEEKLRAERVLTVRPQEEEEKIDTEVCAIGFDDLGNAWIFDNKAYEWVSLGAVKFEYKTVPIEITNYNHFNTGEQVIICGLIGADVPFTGTVIAFQKPHKAKSSEVYEDVIEIEPPE